MPDESMPSWNLFVSVLLDVLRPRNADLDTVRYRAQLFPEKIRRLKESMEYQGKFPVLNPRELAQVKAAFQLSVEEEQQLIAATLATAIEAKLVPRIRAQAALQAAWAMLPILVKAIQEAEMDVASPLHSVRQGGTMESRPIIEQRFSEALEAIDAATLAYYMGAQARDDRDRQASVVEARAEFARALRVLERADAATQQDPVWRRWHEEASAGLREVDDLI